MSLRSCHLIVGVIFLFLLPAAVYGQTPSQQPKSEEQIIRDTYAKLTFACESEIIRTAVQETEANKTAVPAELDKTLSDCPAFTLSDFHIGHVGEIEQVKLTDLVTAPTGDVIDAETGGAGHTFVNEGGSTGAKSYSQPIINFKWKPSALSHYAPLFAGKETIAEITSRANSPLRGSFTRYARFTVKVTMERRSLAYQALFLFNGTNSQEVQAADLITNLRVVSDYVAIQVYPQILMESSFHNVPFVAEWLAKKKMACQVKAQEVCCMKGQCGISTNDLNRVQGKPAVAFPHSSSQSMVVAPSPNSPATATAARSCFASNFSNVIPQFNIDSKEHATGDHHNNSSIVASCSYVSNGTQWCVTKCVSQASSGPAESGVLTNKVQVHVKSGQQNSGTFEGVNGADATCAGTTAVAVQDCIDSGCSVDLTIEGTTNGVGAKIHFPPTTVWVDQQNNGITCKAVQDATFVADGGGVGVPDPGEPPCVLGFSGDTQGLCSPIIIDTEGEGFHLTSAANGVMFDIRGNGHPIRIGWTAPGSHNAFLALPGPDGIVDTGKELFGNFSPQPKSSHPNGFLALAEWDRPENGGNGDGIIDEHDQVFSRLRLWIDSNHDGISQPEELHTLPDLGVFSLTLAFTESARTDQYGNAFRYRGGVNPGLKRDERDQLRTSQESEVGRWAWDVFFVTE